MDNKHTRFAVIAGFGTVALLGVGIFALALQTFPARLQAPFGLKPALPLQDISFDASLSGEFLKGTKDTDRDGIPDAQELQVYKTSPFLEDSDSDGVGDKAEIEAGEDPNCPKGVDCRALVFPSVRQEQQKELARKLYETTRISQVVEQGIPGITDAASIRAFLRQAGITEDVLNQFSDEALVKIVREGVQVPIQTEGLSSGAPEDSPSVKPGLPANPSASAIRDLLLQAGVDRALLEKFSDEQLSALYQDVLKDTQKSDQ